MSHRKPKNPSPKMLLLPSDVRILNAHFSVVAENVAILEHLGEDGDKILRQITDAETQFACAFGDLMELYEILQTRRYTSAPMPALMKEELDALQIKTEL